LPCVAGKNVLLATFGDMMRVPGSTVEPPKRESRRRNIRIVYSPLEALRLAKRKPGKEK